MGMVSVGCIRIVLWNEIWYNGTPRQAPAAHIRIVLWNEIWYNSLII